MGPPRWLPGRLLWLLGLILESVGSDGGSGINGGSHLFPSGQLTLLLRFGFLLVVGCRNLSLDGGGHVELISLHFGQLIFMHLCLAVGVEEAELMHCILLLDSIEGLGENVGWLALCSNGFGFDCSKGLLFVHEVELDVKVLCPFCIFWILCK